MARAAFILVAAGSGTRMKNGAGDNDLPKQLRTLGDKILLDWSLDAAQASGLFDDILVIWPKKTDRSPAWAHWLASRAASPPICVDGGATRTASVQAGIDALQNNPPDYVYIHDAARPGLDISILKALQNALTSADCSAPVLPVVDALKCLDKDANPISIDRTHMRRIQTPQAFRYTLIKTALMGEAEFDDDISAVMSPRGLRSMPKFSPIKGQEKLRKLTFPEDLTILESLLVPKPELPNIRMGHGYDVHAFETGGHVTLCGISIPHTHKLAGHSDADVGWHALTDALLGAIAKGDIGDHFPPSDPNWKGVASEVFLLHAAKLVEDAGYLISNIDLTLICEAPKIGPHRDAMRAATAKVIGLDQGQVSIKATTTEQLGFTGRREGIAAQASVLIQRS